MDTNLQDTDNVVLYILFPYSVLQHHHLPVPVSYLLPILPIHIHLKCKVIMLVEQIHQYDDCGKLLQSCGCFVVEKHPSADMYRRRAPPTGSSLKPLDRNTINWLSVGLYSRYLWGLSRICLLSPFSR